MKCKTTNYEYNKVADTRETFILKTARKAMHGEGVRGESVRASGWTD